MLILEKINRIYPSSNGDIRAIDDVNLHIQKGDFAVINGPSGCGKTTLLMVISGMCEPNYGKVFFQDCDISSMNMARKSSIRGDNFGFVFQSFHLVPYLNVLENVMLAERQHFSNSSKKAMEILKKVGIADRAGHFPSQLSAGEKQRTAIARAILKNPAMILADEPTGNLDMENEKIIFEYLKDYNKNGGTVIAATHSESAKKYANRFFIMNSGKIEEKNAS